MPRQVIRKKVNARVDWIDVARFSREQWPREYPCPITPLALRRWRSIESEAAAASTHWNDDGTAWHDVIRPAYEEAVAAGRRATA